MLIMINNFKYIFMYVFYDKKFLPNTCLNSVAFLNCANNNHPKLWLKHTDMTDQFLQFLLYFHTFQVIKLFLKNYFIVLKD